MWARYGMTRETPTEVKVRSRILFSKQSCIKTWIQSTQSFESLSVHEIQSGVDLTSNTDAHALLLQNVDRLKKRKYRRKKKNQRYCSPIQRCSVKSASLAANPSSTDQTCCASPLWSNTYLSVHKGSFWNFKTTNQQVSIFKQRNRNNKREVNLLLSCQQSLKGQLPKNHVWVVQIFSIA